MTKAELKALLEAGEITQEEFDAKVAELDADNNGDPKTYPEAVVKKLREENAKRRTAQRELKSKLDEMEAKFATIDLEEVEELLARKAELETSKMEKKGEFDKLLQKNNEAHDKELKKVATERDDLANQKSQLEAELDNTVLAYEISLYAAESKCLNPQMLQMWVSNEAKIEKLDNGKRVIRFLDGEGEERLCPKTGKPFTIKQRIEEMKADPATAMLFEGASYGAGSHNTPGGTGTTVNPWKEDTFNLTEQGKLVRENPDLAKSLAAKAGKKLNI